MKKSLAIAASLALAGAGFATLPFAAVSAAGPAANAWEIGPFINGRSYSPGMPARPDATRAGPSFEIPGPTARQGHVHYVTTRTGPLAGAERITLRYRIDAPRGTRFVAQEYPDRTATLSLYFQRAGDSWTTRHPDYRWYAPDNRAIPLEPGTHEISIGLDENWIAMTGPDAHANPRGFAEALAQTVRVGFVFGSTGGRGHGVYATQPARFTVLDFEIE